MTKLYKNTGIEYEITYPPPPEPLPPEPDPQIPKPPKTNVKTQTETPSSGSSVKANGQIFFASCITPGGFKGVRMYMGGRPASGCMNQFQGLGV